MTTNSDIQKLQVAMAIVFIVGAVIGALGIWVLTETLDNKAQISGLLQTPGSGGITASNLAAAIAALPTLDLPTGTTLNSVELLPASTKGDKGDKGDTGDKGDKGDQGDLGPQGIQGIQGIQGAVGATGATGAAGPPGLIGSTYTESLGTLSAGIQRTVNHNLGGDVKLVYMIATCDSPVEGYSVGDKVMIVPETNSAGGSPYSGYTIQILNQNSILLLVGSAHANVIDKSNNNVVGLGAGRFSFTLFVFA